MIDKGDDGSIINREWDRRKNVLWGWVLNILNLRCLREIGRNFNYIVKNLKFSEEIKSKYVCLWFIINFVDCIWSFSNRWDF